MKMHRELGRYAGEFEYAFYLQYKLQEFAEYAKKIFIKYNLGDLL
jgi:hypothetical protein